MRRETGSQQPRLMMCTVCAKGASRGPKPPLAAYITDGGARLRRGPWTVKGQTPNLPVPEVIPITASGLCHADTVAGVVVVVRCGSV